jgi:hypothetical protein
LIATCANIFASLIILKTRVFIELIAALVALKFN